MRSKQSIALTLFAIGVFMGGLDNGIMSSALTTLVHSFKVSASWGAWLITIYTLGLAISVPVMSKFSDRYGRKKMFLLSIALFGAGSMCVALSHSFTMILLSRVLQSLGGGGIFPIANGYIVATVPVNKQGRALGMVGGMNGISAILGPNIGSFILSATHDWHWLFWINVPIAVLLVILGARGLEESRAEGTGQLDKMGIILMSLGVLGLMYGLTNLKGAHLLQNLAKPNVWAYAGVGVVLLIALLWYENRIDRMGSDSLVPMSLLRKKELLWTLFIGFLSGLLLSSVIFLPAFIQVILGWPSNQAGYWYTPMALASGIGAMGGGAFMDKRGPIITLSFGVLSAAVGSMLFPLWVQSTWQMVIASSLVGLGVGVTLGAPLNFLITEKVPQNKSTALGILSLVREIGLTLGPTIYAGFLTRGMAQFPVKLMQDLKAIGISPSQIPASELNRMNHVSGFGSISGQIDKIPNAAIRHAVSQALLAAGKVGFHHLYWSAFWISILSFVCILFVQFYRKKSNDSASDAAALM